MKAQDKVRLESLRFLWSLIKNKEIDEKKELSDEQVMEVVKSEVKKRKEALEQMRGGDRVDAVKVEEEKLKVVEEFMPEQMGEEEIEKIVDEVMGHPSLKLRNGADFGKVMGMVMGKTRGQADGKMVANVVKKKLDRG